MNDCRNCDEQMSDIEIQVFDYMFRGFCSPVCEYEYDNEPDNEPDPSLTEVWDVWRAWRGD